MAKPNPNPNPNLLLLFSLLFSLLPLTAAVSDSDLDAAIAALRSHGYNLFGNAITASDVRLDLTRNPNDSFTLFASTDAALFALDMTSAAAAYVAALRFHVALGIVSDHYLRSLPDRAPLRTLAPYRDVVVSRREAAGSQVVMVDGVDVVVPGLFYGRDVAVHGLDGILPFRLSRSSANPPNLTPRSRDSRISPVPRNSPSILPVPRHSPSISPVASHSPSISPAPSHPPSISSTPSHSPSISPVSQILPSIASVPNRDHSEVGSANPPDLGSPIVSPVSDAPFHAAASPEAAVGITWNDCKEKAAVGCSQSTGIGDEIGGHGGEVHASLPMTTASEVSSMDR